MNYRREYLRFRQLEAACERSLVRSRISDGRKFFTVTIETNPDNYDRITAKMLKRSYELLARDDAEAMRLARRLFHQEFQDKSYDFFDNLIYKAVPSHDLRGYKLEAKSKDEIVKELSKDEIEEFLQIRSHRRMKNALDKVPAGTTLYNPDFAKLAGELGVWVEPEYQKRRGGSNAPVRSGKDNPFYGKHHSDESKEMISKGLSGHLHPNYGKELPDEVKAKMSQAKKGKPSGFSGKKHSAAAKEKMRQAAKNRKKKKK